MKTNIENQKSTDIVKVVILNENISAIYLINTWFHMKF